MCEGFAAGIGAEGLGCGDGCAAAPGEGVVYENRSRGGGVWGDFGEAWEERRGGGDVSERWELSGWPAAVGGEVYDGSGGCAAAGFYDQWVISRSARRGSGDRFCGRQGGFGGAAAAGDWGSSGAIFGRSSAIAAGGA